MNSVPLLNWNLAGSQLSEPYMRRLLFSSVILLGLLLACLALGLERPEPPKIASPPPAAVEETAPAKVRSLVRHAVRQGELWQIIKAGSPAPTEEAPPLEPLLITDLVSPETLLPPDITFTGRVEDSRGRPLTHVRIEAEPINESPNRVVQLFPKKSVGDRSGMDGMYSINVPVPGPYMLTFRPWNEDGRILSRQRVMVRKEMPPVVTVFTHRPVTCRLLDRAGNPLTFDGFMISLSRRDGSGGMGTGSMSMDSFEEVSFFWPGPDYSITINLSSGGGEGELTMESPNHPCRISLK